MSCGAQGEKAVSFVGPKCAHLAQAPSLMFPTPCPAQSSGKRCVCSLQGLQDPLPVPGTGPLIWGHENRPGSPRGGRGGRSQAWLGLWASLPWPRGLINSERGFQRPLDLPHQAAPISLSGPRDWKEKNRSMNKAARESRAAGHLL